jgi:hypothetical protein
MCKVYYNASSQQPNWTNTSLARTYQVRVKSFINFLIRYLYPVGIETL